MNLKLIYRELENEPNYRKKQIEKAIFCDLVENWSEVTTLPKELREKLDKKSPLKIDGEIFKSQNSDSSKAIIRLEDGKKIETVLMSHKDGHNTVCVSSQVGCPLGCKFCATGQNGFERNLVYLEIIEQVLFFARYLKHENEKVGNVVFMGMGEPFLNYENVWKAIRFLNDEAYFNIGARRISISTIGVTEGIRKMAKEDSGVNLAVSLHATNDELRTELVPSNKKYNISRILEAVDFYIERTNRKVMFEYLLIKDVNSSMGDARELAKLMNKKLYMVNLIPYNPTDKFKPPTIDDIRKFKNILEKSKINVTERQRFGQDIKGACGQLVSNKK